ncbi:MAG: NERD domain-containing protein [Thermoproteus sp.]|nr:NERD domain-containing protein [Thermoproteus sp.]
MECRAGLARAVESAVLGVGLSQDELACLEELGLARGGLLHPKPYLIYKALELGARIDLAKISRALSWREFEEMVEYVLEGWGFSVQRGLRIECGGRLFEFDVLAKSKDKLIVAEVKHWKYGGSKWGEIARAHLKKTAACAGKLRGLAPKVIPVVVTLTSTDAVIGGVPVISISSLNGLLAGLDDLGDEIIVFT